jgi:ligand-binding SRPBCC domain-containing protein
MQYELTDHFVVKASETETWDFFSSAENLPAITPPWLAFKILTPHPIKIEAESLLDYTIKWFGLPIHWRTRIIDWAPPRSFIDLQLKGPYTLWHHQHTFTPSTEGTICTDRVIYQLPLGPLAWPVQRWIVRKQLLEIFRFRRKVIADRLGWVRAIQPDVDIRRLR